MKRKEVQQKLNEGKSEIKPYISAFFSGCTSGFTGELVILAEDRKLTSSNVLGTTFRDNCVISGIQQVAKDFSKNTLRKNQTMSNLNKTNPFLFGASTGLPMWLITRFFATPIQNCRKKEPTSPYAGFVRSVVNDAAYHTCKNGIDEYFAQRVFPKLLPQFPNYVVQKSVESLVAGVIGSSCYLISWPYKTVIAGQPLKEAIKLANRNYPKIVVKKFTYTFAKPQWDKLIH